MRTASPPTAAKTTPTTTSTTPISRIAFNRRRRRLVATEHAVNPTRATQAHTHTHTHTHTQPRMGSADTSIWYVFDRHARCPDDRKPLRYSSVAKMLRVFSRFGWRPQISLSAARSTFVIPVFCPYFCCIFFSVCFLFFFYHITANRGEYSGVITHNDCCESQSINDIIAVRDNISSCIL